jgi:hypothetical protein
MDRHKSGHIVPLPGFTGEQSGGLFYKVTRLRCHNFTVKNAPEYALRCFGITRGDFCNLTSEHSAGSAFAFGIAVSDDKMKECYFDNIHSYNSAGGGGAWRASGNSIVFTGDDCSFGSVYSSGDYNGFKIQDDSTCVSIGQFTVKNSATWGLKILGGATPEDYNKNIAVGQVISSGCGFAGVEIEHAKNISIGSIISNGDAHTPAAGGYYDAVFIDNANSVNIGSISIVSPGSAGVLVGQQASDVHIDSITVTGPSAIDVTNAPCVGLWGTRITSNSIISVDTTVGQNCPCNTVNTNVAVSLRSIGCVIAKGFDRAWPVIFNNSSSDHTCLVRDFVFRNTRIGQTPVNNADAWDADSTPYSTFLVADTIATHAYKIVGGALGQTIRFVFTNLNTDVDFTSTLPGHNLVGNGGNLWTPRVGDVMTATAYELGAGLLWVCGVSS